MTTQSSSNTYFAYAREIVTKIVSQGRRMNCDDHTTVGRRARAQKDIYNVHAHTKSSKYIFVFLSVRTTHELCRRRLARTPLRRRGLSSTSARTHRAPQVDEVVYFRTQQRQRVIRDGFPCNLLFLHPMSYVAYPSRGICYRIAVKGWHCSPAFSWNLAVCTYIL